jgi:hypothetical protein
MPANTMTTGIVQGVLKPIKVKTHAKAKTKIVAALLTNNRLAIW